MIFYRWDFDVLYRKMTISNHPMIYIYTLDAHVNNRIDL